MAFPLVRFQPCPTCCEPNCKISEDPLAPGPVVWDQVTGDWYPGADFLQGQAIDEPALLHRPTVIEEPAYILSVNWQIFDAGQVLELSVAVEQDTRDGLTVRFTPGHNNTGEVALLDYDGTVLHAYTLTYLNFEDVTVGGVFSVCIEEVMGEYYITATSFLQVETMGYSGLPERLTFPAYTRGSRWGDTVTIGTPVGSIINISNATLYETANTAKGCPPCTQLGCEHCNNGVTSKCLKLTFAGIVSPLAPDDPWYCGCLNRSFTLSWFDCGFGSCRLEFQDWPDTSDLIICLEPGDPGCLGGCDEPYYFQVFAIDGVPYLEVVYHGVRFRAQASESDLNCTSIDKTITADATTCGSCDWTNATVHIESLATGCPGCHEEGSDEHIKLLCPSICGCDEAASAVAIDLDAVTVNGLEITGTFVIAAGTPGTNLYPGCMAFYNIIGDDDWGNYQLEVAFFIYEWPAGSGNGKAVLNLYEYPLQGGVSDIVPVTIPVNCTDGTWEFSLGGGTATVTAIT